MKISRRPFRGRSRLFDAGPAISFTIGVSRLLLLSYFRLSKTSRWYTATLFHARSRQFIPRLSRKFQINRLQKYVHFHLKISHVLSSLVFRGKRAQNSCSHSRCKFSRSQSRAACALPCKSRSSLHTVISLSHRLHFQRW